MKKRLKALKIYYLPIFIALIIALIQLVLSSNYTLSRWEGGGFGMYTEPHPNSSRIVGISISNPGGEINLRLSPPDKKISYYVKKMKGKKRDNWDKLIKDSDRIRRFPKYALTDDYIRRISTELLDINYNLETKMRSINIPITVKVYVIQLNMNIKESNIQTKMLYTKTLDI